MNERVQIASQQGPVRVYQSTEFFIYVTNPAVMVVSDGITAQASVPIQTDSDFELLAIAYAADIGGALQTLNTQVVALATLQIQQSGSGIDIMPSPVPLASVAGDGRLPFILPESRIWPGNSAMTINLASYAVVGTTYNIRLSFIGRKLFYQSQ